jgi:AraC family transcriptional activator of pobA
VIKARPLPTDKPLPASVKDRLDNKEWAENLMMTELKSNIPYYKDINDFLKSIPTDFETKNPHFFCLRLKENEGSIINYKPPFHKDFYFIALVSNAGKTKITYDNTHVTKLNSFLVFQSPGLLYSFYRDKSANGYLIYFKKECLSFFKPGLMLLKHQCLK